MPKGDEELLDEYPGRCTIQLLWGWWARPQHQNGGTGDHINGVTNGYPEKHKSSHNLHLMTNIGVKIKIRKEAKTIKALPANIRPAPAGIRTSTPAAVKTKKEVTVTNPPARTKIGKEDQTRTRAARIRKIFRQGEIR
ncbi:uncharacterized protein LOC113373790 [Ctenocephalides felis]|uniref:uncharacterized protein LOC113373790 n=1 Tax=Ctenocephalides felis TaxID=7515 RepID=UPI000E6E2E53|nr:uncharacterized protein LOC113373790 [Ctenocephalides felis]